MSTLVSLARVSLPSVPGVNRLPGVRKRPGADPSRLVRERREVAADRDAVRRYAALCGFAEGDTLPLTYPHLLAFPLQLALMADPSFPYPAVGLVHIANAITGHRPLQTGERLAVTTRATAPHPHRKGTSIDLRTEVRADGAVVWESRSTYLRRGAPSPGAADRGQPGSPVPGTDTWSLPGDLGRRYAAVSGDFNPIHLYPMTARALGFRRQIAHGMWSLARCVAAIDDLAPEAVRVEATFAKPILLPDTVTFGLAQRDRGVDFALTRPADGAPHVIGRATPA